MIDRWHDVFVGVPDDYVYSQPCGHTARIRIHDQNGLLIHEGSLAEAVAQTRRRATQ